MASVNKAIIVGNVGKDPEIRSFQNGGRVASFSVATSERWKDKASGEQKERTEWHRISVLNENLVSVVERFVTKGSKLYIEGQLETRKWTDTSGAEKYSTEVVLRPYRGELVLLDGKSGPATNTISQDPYAPAPSQGVEMTSGLELDDEIPF
jgi:single-strand DNA-binding protein